MERETEIVTPVKREREGGERKIQYMYVVTKTAQCHVTKNDI